MEINVYEEIEQYCEECISKLTYVKVSDLKNKIKLQSVPFQTIVAIMSQSVQTFLKKSWFKGKDLKYIEQAGVEFIRHNKSVHEIATLISYPPYLVGKMILNYIINISNKSNNNNSNEKGKDTDSKKKNSSNNNELIKKCINDTSLIRNLKLRKEIEYWYEHDPYASPYIDRLKHVTGEEYEYILMKKLSARNITFKAEEALKLEGAEKTPDALITIPFSVRSRSIKSKEDTADRHYIVNWIDSKAMFGDEKEHMKYMKQYTSYRSRYGPGMVIYWFGYVETIADYDEDIFVTSDFPLKDDILLM